MVAGKPVKSETAQKRRKISSNAAVPVVDTPTSTSTYADAAAAAAAAVVPPSDPSSSSSAASETPVDNNVKREETEDDTSEEESQVVTVADDLDLIYREIGSLISMARKLGTKVKETQRLNTKEKKQKNKKRKSQDSGEDAAPKPEKVYTVTEPLHSFLGLKDDEKISKPAARRQVQDYIWEQKLLDPNNRHLIIPDEKLKAVLGEARFKIKGKEVGYANLNLRNYIDNYFDKSSESIVTHGAPAPSSTTTPPTSPAVPDAAAVSPAVPDVAVPTPAVPSV